MLLSQLDGTVHALLVLAICRAESRLPFCLLSDCPILFGCWKLYKCIDAARPIFHAPAAGLSAYCRRRQVAQYVHVQLSL